MNINERELKEAPVEQCRLIARRNDDGGHALLRRTSASLGLVNCSVQTSAKDIHIMTKIRRTMHKYARLTLLCITADNSSLLHHTSTRTSNFLSQTTNTYSFSEPIRSSDTMSKPTNFAAWMPAPKQRLQVSEAPLPTPGSHEIVIKNRAIAINPIDWIVQAQGTALAFSFIKYPYVFGCDVAGEVVEVGGKVAQFKVGDRVVGQALSTVPKIGTAVHGGFQLYTVLIEKNTCIIPDSLTFEVASVMPLGLATAAAGLFQKDQLGLQYPSLDAKPTGQTVLVWGGSTSVGCNAIQLAVAAGYEVISTSSPKNFGFVKALGASQVFDYKSPSVIADIVRAMDGRVSAGAIAIGDNSVFRCLDVLGRCKGNRKIALATFPIPANPKRFAMLQIIFSFVTSMISIFIESKIRGIKTSFIFGSVADDPVGDVIYGEFLPKALASGKFKATPEPIVVGQGLESIQEAINVQKEGVSAKKVVVLID